MMRFSPAFRSLLLAVVVFGAVVGLTYRPALTDQSERAPHVYGLDVELKGSALAEQVELVEDTFAGLAAWVERRGSLTASEWGLRTCCADGMPGEERLFQWWGDFGFRLESDRLGLVRDALAQGWVQVEDWAVSGEGMAGLASARLPVPGSEERLELEGVLFWVRGL